MWTEPWGLPYSNREGTSALLKKSTNVATSITRMPSKINMHGFSFMGFSKMGLQFPNKRRLWGRWEGNKKSLLGKRWQMSLMGYGTVFGKGDLWAGAWANLGLQQLLGRRSVLVKVRWAQDCSSFLHTAPESFQSEVGKLKKLFLFSDLLAWFAQTPANQSLKFPSPPILRGNSNLLAAQLGFQSYLGWPGGHSTFWILACCNQVTEGSEMWSLYSRMRQAQWFNLLSWLVVFCQPMVSAEMMISQVA